jgi:hypothetical protein
MEASTAVLETLWQDLRYAVRTLALALRSE